MEKPAQGIFSSSTVKGGGRKLQTHYSPQIHHHHSQFCMDLHSNFSKLGCKPAKLTVISAVSSSERRQPGCTLSSSTVSAHITVGPMQSYLHYEHFDTARTKLLPRATAFGGKKPRFLTKIVTAELKADGRRFFGRTGSGLCQKEHLGQ